MLVLLLALLVASPAGAQSQAVTPQCTLTTVVQPGMLVWITDSTGREERMRIVAVTPSELIGTTDTTTRRIAVANVRRVTTRRSDSVIDGALIGAGMAIATGLALCRATEPWRNCVDDVGPMARIGAVGAGIGVVVDALIRGRRTVYEVPRRSPVVVLHSLGQGRRGAALTVWF